MNKFVVLIIGSLISFLMLKYRAQVKQFIGDVDFAEKYLGSGGTNTLIVILALLIFVLCLMYSTGTLDSLIPSGVEGLF